MAEKRSMIVYYEILEQLEDFTDEQVGKIFRAMIDYDKNGIEPDFTGEMRVAFKFIKLSLDKNKEEYAKKCEKNREIALGRWKSKKDEDETLKQTNDKLRRQRLQNARNIATHTESEWLDMKAFFNFTCVKCGNNDCELVKDHIKPIYQGGSDGLYNIQPLCRKCNSSKGSDSTDYREVYCNKHGLENVFSYKNVCERSSSLANDADIETDLDYDFDYEYDKKKENNKKEKKSKSTTSFDVSSVINQFEFTKDSIDSINEWLTYKTEKHQTYKETGLKTLCKRLYGWQSNFGDTYVVDAINFSISSNYDGIFPNRTTTIKAEKTQQKTSKYGTVL